MCETTGDDAAPYPQYGVPLSLWLMLIGAEPPDWHGIQASAKLSLCFGPVSALDLPELSVWRNTFHATVRPSKTLHIQPITMIFSGLTWPSLSAQPGQSLSLGTLIDHFDMLRR
jgi:hypothetical protein